jgi:hypothetical protein
MKSDGAILIWLREQETFANGVKPDEGYSHAVALIIQRWALELRQRLSGRSIGQLQLAERALVSRKMQSWKREDGPPPMARFHEEAYREARPPVFDLIEKIKAARADIEAARKGKRVG